MLPATMSDFFLQMCLYENDIRIGLFVCDFCLPYPQGVCLCGRMENCFVSIGYFIF